MILYQDKTLFKLTKRAYILNNLLEKNAKEMPSPNSPSFVAQLAKF